MLDGSCDGCDVACCGALGEYRKLELKEESVDAGGEFVKGGKDCGEWKKTVVVEFEEEDELLSVVDVVRGGASSYPPAGN